MAVMLPQLFFYFYFFLSLLLANHHDWPFLTFAANPFLSMVMGKSQSVKVFEVECWKQILW